jgi:mRNA interferase RelE/StbE
MHNIILHRNAVKFFEKADTITKNRISEAFDIISKNPRYHPHIKKLKGELKHMFRFRLGNLRIIYEIEEDIQTVRVKVIERRGSVYRSIAE